MIVAALIAAAAVTGITARDINMTQNQKLRMAEAAVAQLYVDTVDETNLVN